MKEFQLVYTLKQIALWAANEKVAIPNVQRGFVWKPAQIENLWDSLLRGYPIGAFVMTPKEDGNFEILDGQQRATAISLGFGTKTLREAPGERIRVFIDVDAKLHDEDARKYLFRVITKSHPWGYQKADPSKSLSAYNIRIALNECYNGADPLFDDIDLFYPWDAEMPVPFQLFINTQVNEKDEDYLWQELQQWGSWKTVFNQWKKKQNNTQNEEALIAEVRKKINVIYRAVSKMLDDEKGQRVPTLYLNHQDWLDEEDRITAEESPDEIENLFVRLNSGGTQLAGEELNYSILKAHIEKNTQDVLEQACEQLFKPSRFITIAFRLYQQNKKSGQADSLSMRIKPKQFQRSFSKREELVQFEEFLLEICTDTSIENHTLLNYVQKVLAYQAEKCPWGLPFLIYSKISDQAPELMFMLMYRIFLRGDRFNFQTNDEQTIHKHMLGMMTLMMWFGRGENLRDHSKLLSQIWPAVTMLNRERFWSWETIERARLNDNLLAFPYFLNQKQGTQELGIESIKEYEIDPKINVLNLFQKKTNEVYGSFLQRIIYNRDLLIYAQRHFLEAYFNTQQYRQEDAAAPFDWDHIFPSSYVYNRRYIEQILKDWYQTIGNFRAWPYALNRMDSDNAPAKKLKPLERNHFPSDQEQENKKNKWEEFIKRNNNLIANVDQLHNKLRSWSYCNEEWANSYYTNLRNDWKPALRLIINRNIEIISEWYKNLKIEDLQPGRQQQAFDLLLDSSKWHYETSGVDKKDNYFDNEETVYMTEPIDLNGSSFYFYIYLSGPVSMLLTDNAIKFGVKVTNTPIFFNMEKLSSDYRVVKDHQAVEKEFTLLSNSENSIRSLKLEMNEFLKKLPLTAVSAKDLQNKLLDTFTQKFRP
jgi:hypothetical protein